jgi:CRISPR/Cas system CMR subunit Cmr4 (Cas7 group RAMP superfamily)
MESRATYFTAPRHNYSEWNAFVNNSSRLRQSSRRRQLSGLRKSKKNKRETIAKDVNVSEQENEALVEAQHIATVASKAVNKLSDPNLSTKTKKKVIQNLSNNLKQSVSVLDKIKMWLVNLTRKIRKGYNNFKYGIKKLFKGRNNSTQRLYNTL